MPLTISGTSCAPDTYEDDDSLAGATSLSPGYVLDQNFCNDTDDWHVIAAVAGQSYTIRATVVGSMEDIYINLFDDGVSEPIIRTTDDHLINSASGVSEAVMTWTPDTTGTYYFHVRTMFGLEHSGPNTDYQLTVTSN